MSYNLICINPYILCKLLYIYGNIIVHENNLINKIHTQFQFSNINLKNKFMIFILYVIIFMKKYI